MSKASKSPKKRNLAAKALREPLFKPKIMENPKAYRRHVKFNKNEVDNYVHDENNQKSGDSVD